MFSQVSVRLHLQGVGGGWVGVPHPRSRQGCTHYQVRMGGYPIPRSRQGDTLPRSGCGHPGQVPGTTGSPHPGLDGGTPSSGLNEGRYPIPGGMAGTLHPGLDGVPTPLPGLDGLSSRPGLGPMLLCSCWLHTIPRLRASLRIQPV